jgi:hypothetical protein
LVPEHDLESALIKGEQSIEPALRSHVALLSGDRANLAIARHSPANFLNSSDPARDSIWTMRVGAKKWAFKSNLRNWAGWSKIGPTWAIQIKQVQKAAGIF